MIYPERKTYELKIQGFAKWLQPFTPGVDAIQSYLAFKYLKDQSFNDKLAAEDGPEMTAARFITNCKGKFRFNNCDVWFDNFRYGRSYYRSAKTAPNVTDVDLSSCFLLYDGLEHLMYLSNLKYLSLRDSISVNDWFLDRLTSPAFRSLEHLDLSGCKLVNSRGIESLARLKNLRYLSLHNMGHIKHLPFLCLLLEDAVPAISISGVDYMVPPALNQLVLAPEDHSDHSGHPDTGAPGAAPHQHEHLALLDGAAVSHMDDRGESGVGGERRSDTVSVSCQS